MIKKRKNTIAGIVIASLLVGGCATSSKVQVVQMGDNRLSCSQLQVEMNKLNQAQRDVDCKKGITGTNVAAALFWTPGLAYTYYDASQATHAINERKSSLTKLYNDKGCH